MTHNALRTSIAALILICCPGCLGLLAARVDPYMERNGEWVGRVERVEVRPLRKPDEVRRLTVLRMRDSSSTVSNRSGRSFITLTEGTGVLLTDKNGAPADLSPTDGWVRISGRLSNRPFVESAPIALIDREDFENAKLTGFVLRVDSIEPAK